MPLSNMRERAKKSVHGLETNISLKKKIEIESLRAVGIGDPDRLGNVI